MAITSYGYDGPITEPQMAQIMPRSGASQVGVVGGGDMKVSAGATAGQVNVAPGTAWGPALVDVSDSIATVTQSSLPSSGSRWDLVVLRRDWTPPGGSSSFQIITGSATKQLPAALSSASSSSTSGRNVFPGTVDDQPLALVRWQAGYTSPQEIVDLRVWAANGGVIAADPLVMSYITQPGSVLRIGKDEWIRDLDANGSPQWTNLDAPGPWVSLNMITNWQPASGSVVRGRLIGRGKFLQLQVEAKYVGSFNPVPGWTVATFPAGLAPSATTLVAAYTNEYKSIAGVWVGASGIDLGQGTSGKTVQFNATVPM